MEEKKVKKEEGKEVEEEAEEEKSIGPIVAWHPPPLRHLVLAK